MNPALQDVLVSILRKGLAAGAVWLVETGVLSEYDAEKYTAAVALGIVSLVWGGFNAYWKRRKIVTALAMPAQSTEKEVEAVIKSGQAAPATLPKTEAPQAITTLPKNTTGE